ncbi:MAG: sensor histidine kinase [Vulcanimicrobiota bacterium]
MSQLLEASLALLDAVPLRLEAGRLTPLVEKPDWLHLLEPLELDSLPFLECGLDEFEACWQGLEPPQVLGPWEEHRGEAVLALEAYPVGGKPGHLVLRNLGQRYVEQVAVLQKAREHALIHEALEKEIRKKEFLLHSIVHDLAGPLTSIKGAYHILSRGDLKPAQVKSLLEIGLRQCDRQEKMIREILEVFAAEIQALAQAGTASLTDMQRVARRVVDGLRPAFEEGGVGLQLEAPDGAVLVVGEDSKLERVLSNLLENALRNLKPGHRVSVRLSRDGEGWQLEVLDDGPGVPEEAVGRLFQKLAKGKTGGGKIGLGLYFCRLTVDSWGGRIGYRRASGGGANFWFWLPTKS